MSRTSFSAPKSRVLFNYAIHIPFRIPESSGELVQFEVIF